MRSNKPEFILHQSSMLRLRLSYNSNLKTILNTHCTIVIRSFPLAICGWINATLKSFMCINYNQTPIKLTTVFVSYNFKSKLRWKTIIWHPYSMCIADIMNQWWSSMFCFWSVGVIRFVMLLCSRLQVHMRNRIGYRISHHYVSR